MWACGIMLFEFLQQGQHPFQHIQNKQAVSKVKQDIQDQNYNISPALLVALSPYPPRL